MEILPRFLVKRQSFKAQLILTIGSLMVVFGAAVGAYYITVTTEELANVGGEALRASGIATSEMLSTEIRERSQEIDLLRRSPLFVEGDLQGQKMREALDLRKSAHDEYQWMGIAGLDGKILQATDGVLVGVDVTERPWFKAAQLRPYAGDVHEAAHLAKQLPKLKANEPLRFLDFASPILDANGQLRAVFAANVSWDWVTDAVVKKVRGPLEHRNAEVMIANSRGQILYPYKYVGTRQLPDDRELHSARYKVVNWDGEGTFLTSVVPVSEVTAYALDWHIVLREPIDSAFKAVRELRLRLIAVSVLALLTCMVVIYRIANATSRPIMELAIAAQHVVRGNARPRFPDASSAGSNDVAALCESVQTMTESLLEREKELEALNTSLEQQVLARTAELSAANKLLEGLAATDGLTGLRNRRHFDERLREQFNLLNRSGRGYAILLIDADHFKRVNDQYGHLVGDEVLKKLADLLSQNTRVTDIVARYGGEEFVVLLMDTESITEAASVAEKIRSSIEAASFPSVERMTVSIGVSLVKKTDAEPFHAVLRADKAVYQAKTNGRNRVDVEMA